MGESEVLHWLEGSTLAVYIRHSHLLYPVIETVHILGFIVLVGSAFLFDLRLLGISKQIPVTALARHLLPWSRRSLWFVLPSGVLLFMTQATSLGNNMVFGVKLILIALAFANAGIFHQFTWKGVTEWDQHKGTILPAKVAGMVSIILWTGVITCGRFLAYLE
jgi:hypothetical protein